MRFIITNSWPRGMMSTGTIGATIGQIIELNILPIKHMHSMIVVLILEWDRVQNPWFGEFHITKPHNKPAVSQAITTKSTHLKILDSRSSLLILLDI